MRRITLAGVALAVVLLAAMALCGSALATTLCLANKANGDVKGPTTVGGSACKSGYAAIELPSASELEILKHASYEPEGIGKKPTVVFSGVNVQVESGAGEEKTLNGAGNLVVGYDETPREQTGSNNLVVGSSEQEYTSFGGFLAGEGNASTFEGASVSGGIGNIASNSFASVTGGVSNTARGVETSISGGVYGIAYGAYDSISGGEGNHAEGDEGDSVGGGYDNTSKGLMFSWIGGGYKNIVGGSYSSIFGGKSLTANNEYEAQP
jgi:hypothetical protein